MSRLTNTRPYRIWLGMRRRCYRKDSHNYHLYGGRGIKICDEWKDDFKTFWKDMKDGYANNLTIDRINNDGDYEPNNCRWYTLKEQANNKRSNVFIEYNGERKTIAQWTVEAGFGYQTILKRLKAGWDNGKTLTTRPRKKLGNGEKIYPATSPNKKLNHESVREIKEMLSLGESGVILAKMYNVSPQTICDIRKGRAWAHD